MKPEKSIEYFSAYYEGTLEPVLKDQFESLLMSDALIAEQYAGFVDSIESLAVLADNRPEAPTDLHEIIMRKVDLNAYELKKSQSKFSFANLKVGFIGLAASIALGAAFMALNPSNSKDSTASMIPGSSNALAVYAGLSLEVVDGKVMMNLNSTMPETVTVSNAETGAQMKQYNLKANQSLIAPILNELAEGSVASINTLNGADQLIIAIPAPSAERNISGEGSILEMAKAFANYSQKPVQLLMKDTSTPVRWKFVSNDPMKAQFELHKVQVELKDGLIRLRD